MSRVAFLIPASSMDGRIRPSLTEASDPVHLDVRCVCRLQVGAPIGAAVDAARLSCARITMQTPSVRSLGQFVHEEGVIDWLTESLRQINAHAADAVRTGAKRKALPVAQCFTCSAKKACCYKMVIAGLHEGVLIAASLKATQRDTEELRAELRARAEAMEEATLAGWSHPCVFLDDKERCTVYGARPRACGTLYVFSPPELCDDDQGRDIRLYLAKREEAAGTQLEEQFRERLALRRKVGRRYIGTLPRMVLIALEAWDRTDFRDYLRQLAWPTLEDAQRWAPPPVEPRRDGT
jgi:Fe-S-cluster containining protein